MIIRNNESRRRRIRYSSLVESTFTYLVFSIMTYNLLKPLVHTIALEYTFNTNGCVLADR